MATLEHEVTREIGVRLSRAQAEAVERAAQAAGQSLDDFAASALLRAAKDALLPASRFPKRLTRSTVSRAFSRTSH